MRFSSLIPASARFKAMRVFPVAGKPEITVIGLLDNPISKDWICCGESGKTG